MSSKQQRTIHGKEDHNLHLLFALKLTDECYKYQDYSFDGGITWRLDEFMGSVETFKDYNRMWCEFLINLLLNAIYAINYEMYRAGRQSLNLQEIRSDNERKC